jgi:hypothetical protein
MQCHYLGAEIQADLFRPIVLAALQVVPDQAKLESGAAPISALSSLQPFCVIYI